MDVSGYVARIAILPYVPDMAVTPRHCAMAYDFDLEGKQYRVLYS
ncbi:MAG: hypothetical protein FD153_791 [Rhodospirillaceae bacterium]|nr:MAG: hypothetical protein FD153_791 [Rhodospirillaceae bacterium]